MTNEPTSAVDGGVPLQHRIAVALADGGPVDDELDAAQAVLDVLADEVAALQVLLRSANYEAAASVASLVARDHDVEVARETIGRQRFKIARAAEALAWAANTVHQAHHAGERDPVDQTWRECTKGFCESIRYELTELNA